MKLLATVLVVQTAVGSCTCKSAAVADLSTSWVYVSVIYVYLGTSSPAYFNLGLFLVSMLQINLSTCCCQSAILVKVVQSLASSS